MASKGSAPQEAESALRRRGPILLIDDDAELGAVVAEYFATHGYRLEVALDGRQGLSRAYALPKSDIEISARADDSQVALSVRDYGPGVPDELLSRIFEPFFRVDVTRTPSTGGVGLGLAIVRRIINLHHGTLKAENEAPGLRVTIAVPLSA